MSKNIVMCCDGTHNQLGGDRTNVVRAYKVSVHDATQITYYDPGVGTMASPYWVTRVGQRWSLLSGLAFGTGLLDNIQEAYCFLMSAYEFGDRVFLFGFSRGAYTVRALAGMLHAVGLAYPGTEHLFPYAVQYWRAYRYDKKGSVALCEEFKASFARSCPVHFIGVWDTVGSVGMMNNFQSFPFTRSNADVLHVRHAVSIDERRSTFRHNLMSTSSGQDFKNVWFSGVHSDVGGGYPAEESGLAKVSFAWMMREAEANGLKLDTGNLQNELYGSGSPPDPCAQMHESLRSLWWAAELIPDRRYHSSDHRWRWHFFNVNHPRSVGRDADKPYVFVHQSVIERIVACPDYRPPNLPHAEEAIRKQFRIEV